MAQYTGPGVNNPPITTPIVDLVPMGSSTYGNEQDVVRDVVREVLQGVEARMTSTWVLFFAEIIRVLEAVITPTTGTLYSDLTPADNVVPTLELVEENGVLAVVLDRVLTTIDPATLDGGTPPDGYRFTILGLNDANQDREMVFDAVYHGAQGSSGMANAVESYSWITLGGEFYISAQETGIL